MSRLIDETLAADRRAKGESEPGQPELDQDEPELDDEEAPD